MSYTLAEKRAFAREMRKKPTLAEAALWYRLRKKKTGFRFRRQHPLCGYILDFYCPQLKLAVEVDGSIHNLPSQMQHDAKRDLVLVKNRVTVLRFTNQDVLDFMSVVMARIEKALSDAAWAKQKADISNRSSCDSLQNAESCVITQMVRSLSESKTMEKLSTSAHIRNKEHNRLIGWLRQRAASSLLKTEAETLPFLGMEIAK